MIGVAALRDRLDQARSAKVAARKAHAAAVVARDELAASGAGETAVEAATRTVSAAGNVVTIAEANVRRAERALDFRTPGPRR